MKKHLFSFLILLIFFCFQYGLLPFPAQNTDSVRIIAHRGDSSHAPENTLPAFFTAMQNGADCIEMDIRCTRDGIPVVFHDANLQRLAGADSRISELTCREFLSYPLVLSGTSANYPSVTPCTLEQALIFCNDYSGLCLHLELKVPDLEEKVVSLIKKYDSVCSYEISSSDAAVLQKIKHLAPEIKTFLLLSSVRDIYHYFSKKPESIDGISIKSIYVTAFLISCAHNRNQKVYAWTVNDTAPLQRLCRLHVDGIITDNPLLFHKKLS